MDTHAGSHDLMSYCLRTARQKKRLQKTDKDKQLIGISKLERQLRKDSREQPLVPLAAPYQRGWVRTFVLRQDVSRSADAPFYEQLLSKVNSVQHCRDKSFTAKTGKRKGGHMPAPMLQALKAFDAIEWRHPKLALTEAERACFNPEPYWDKRKQQVAWRYVCSEPWRYVLQVAPHIITHARRVDGVLEQQIKQLANHIDYQQLRYRMELLTNGRGYNRWRRSRKTPERMKDTYRNKTLQAILAESTN